MPQQPPKDASNAASDAPTELDLSGVAGDAPDSAARHAAPTVGLKQATLEPADGREPRAISQRSADAYLDFIIDGRFHIESVIASGGMGVVYKARHRVIDKAVAIKILRPELVHDRDITERFLTEAQAASAVGNEHIVDITDYGELPDGATYLVMEYLEGESLGRRLKRANDPLLVSEVGDIARQLAEGLHQAHEAQIIHRDLKPDNVFLISRGKEPNFVKILDFGIAKVQSSQNQETRAGRIFGTPHYMSPEQARGEPLDRRSDIYAFGVMLYQMLSGRLPFDGENPLGILTQHMYVEPTPLCDICDEKVPAGLEAVVLKCLSKVPDERYETLESVEGDLLRFRAGQMPLAVLDLLSRKTTPRRLRKKLRKTTRKGSPLVFPLLLLAGTGAAAFSIWQTAPDWRAVSLWDWRAVSLWAKPAATGASSAGVHPQAKTVALVLSPIDAHVFRGNRDLGAMPLNVRLREGERLELEVRREGYASQRLVVDGSSTRALVELIPLPGTDPPLATETPGRVDQKVRVISFEDGGVQTRVGAPLPLPAVLAGQRLDAGSPKAGVANPIPARPPPLVNSAEGAPAASPPPAPPPRPAPTMPATREPAPEPPPEEHPPGPPPQKDPR